MKRSENRILTSHSGGLHMAEWGPKVAGAAPLEQKEVKKRVGVLVQKQMDIGIDIVNNGDLGWRWSPLNAATVMTGIEMAPVKPGDDRLFFRSLPDEDMERYSEYYRNHGLIDITAIRDHTDRMMGSIPPVRQVCTGPISPLSTEALQWDIRTLKEAVGARSVADIFMCAIAPGWMYRCLWNDYYRTDEEFIFAIAEGLKPSYKAIVDAGFVLQVDDPNIVDCWTWERFTNLEDYRKYIDMRIEALNNALQGLPEEQIRVHVCWGSWCGPHSIALPLKDAIDRVYRVRAQCLSIEAAKANHTHEWKVFKDFKLPEGKIVMPGVVDHTSPVIEHPEVIADRLINYANVVGKQNVIAGTDCGFRLDAEVNWAKYEAMVQGARLASQALWK
jgi:5-methyltetrahydropteroyltriglutamate--homocysteine methyltransferase